MSPGSLSPLSPKARALLAAERDISPQPELVRRRAQLRARTALWHARRSSHASLWQRVRWLAVAALCATSALAAWLTVQPAPLPDGPPTVVTSPARHPFSQRAPLTATPPADSGQQQQLSPPGDDSELKPKQTATQGSSPSRERAVSTQQRASSSDELALLDRARRSLVAGDFRTALRSIDRHARSFPNSQLGEEREALRVRALKGAGLSKKASQAARDFESRYPKSVLAPELNKDHRTAP